MIKVPKHLAGLQRAPRRKKERLRIHCFSHGRNKARTQDTPLSFLSSFCETTQVHILNPAMASYILHLAVIRRDSLSFLGSVSRFFSFLVVDVAQLHTLGVDGIKLRGPGDSLMT